MTRKDYIALAGAIKEAVDFVDDQLNATAEMAISTLGLVTARIVGVLAADNPLFDHKRFYEACGLSVPAAML